MINFLEIPFHFYFFHFTNILNFFLLKWHVAPKLEKKKKKKKVREKKEVTFLCDQRKKINFLLFSGLLEAFPKAACIGSTSFFKLLKF